MTAQVKVIDNQPVIVLPPDMAKRLRLGAESEIGCVVSPNGVELITDLEMARQLQIARAVMDEDHEALGELAK